MTQEKEGKARTNLEIAEYALAGFLMSQEALDASARLIRQVKEALDQKDTIIQSLEKRFDTAQHYDNLLVMEDNYNKIASLEKQVERLVYEHQRTKDSIPNPNYSQEEVDRIVSKLEKQVKKLQMALDNIFKTEIRVGMFGLGQSLEEMKFLAREALQENKESGK